MDDRTRVPELQDGRVKMTGGELPDSFPHLCPYQEKGASKEFCADTTSNYQRNLNGCCGTRDSRAFAPCNSMLRKCIKCLAEGNKSKPVVDIRRGLCADHVQVADNPVPKKVYQPQPVARRFAVDAGDITSTRSRPVFARAPLSVDVPLPKPTQYDRPVKPYEPPGKPAPIVEKDQTPVDEMREQEAEEVEAVTPATPSFTPDELDAMAKKKERLSPRQAETLELILACTQAETAARMGISEAAVKQYFVTGCSVLGIPRNHRHKPYDRLAALRLVWAHDPPVKSPASTPDPHEKVLLELYRSMSSEKRLIALRVMRAIKSE